MSFHSTHDMERKTLCCSLKTHFIDPTTKQEKKGNRKKKVQLETEKQAKAHEDAGVGRTLKKSAMHFKR